MKDREAVTAAIVMAVMIVAVFFIVGHVFLNSLPTWCANPDRPGNRIVQPLCPVEKS